ncbi:MAG: DUF116 domain-containing protein [Cetobacterium sp.]|nr:DUF116 domain-containing protein [Cetobacterium sp. 2A]MBC2856628.1 DUF116 domain-containing protein [Cetobacterium sp. 2A]
MIKLFFKKLVYDFFYISFIIDEKLGNKNKNNSKLANVFLKYNNEKVKKIIKRKKINNISILLPHCIQKYECPFKITSDIENCKKCGKCKIGDILNLKDEFKIDVKVATGGTLARLYLRERKPDLIIAVACKRDLVSGIYDAFPLDVYGVFNIIKESPCINTDVSINSIRELLKEVRGS